MLENTCQNQNNYQTNNLFPDCKLNFSENTCQNQNNYQTDNLVPDCELKLKILSRSKCETDPNENNFSRILYPTLPYHIRMQKYIEKRNEIFNVATIDQNFKSKPKRSTLRIRAYYKLRRRGRKLLISAIISSNTDNRFYARVSFLNFTEYGLIDTGANISCLGGDLAQKDFSCFPNFTKCRYFVKTADGQIQNVIGWVAVDIEFKNRNCRINLFIIPSIKQSLILGIDFCKAFDIIPNIVESLDIVDKDMLGRKHLSKHKIDPSEVPDISELTTENLEFPLTCEQKQQLNTIIALFPNYEQQGLGRTALIEHQIDLVDCKPIKQRFYPVSPAVEKLMYTEIDRMLALGVIEPSQSPWSSPMRLVIKPNKIRLCLDARKLNSVTKKDAYPLPSIEGIFSRLPKANIISKLDLKDAYWQIGLSDAAKPLTAFTIPGRPLYQFVVMPFGLCNAPSTMCRLVDQIIPPDLRHTVFGYLDDLIIVSENFQTHLSILVRIAEQLRKANLTLNISKSHFCVTKVQYLGYVIGNGGISTDPEKVSAISNWPIPKTIRQVRGFLGLAGWYRRFVENFSSVVFPITEVLSSKKTFCWTEDANEAFRKIKQLLTTAPVLINPDFSRKFFIQCDASDFGIGAVLVQLDDEGNERPVAFMSKKLNSSQRNYSVTEKECLAALEAINRFRCYIELQEFEVITDHASLVWLMKQANLSGRLARWMFKLQAYKFTVSHRKGKENIVPDALSRSFNGEVSELSVVEPEIDLSSEHFSDLEYIELRNKISENKEKYPDIKVVDKFMYIRTEYYTGDSIQEENSWKLWVPFKLRKNVIERAHNDPIRSHGGMVKTIQLIRRHLYWPGLVKDVREYVRKCEVCKATKAPNVSLKPEMGRSAVSIRPLQRLYIDLLGPYPRSKDRNIGILIVLDHLTKFHWLFPIRKFCSNTIMDILEKQIFHVFGVPETIISDNGSQFRANNFNAFLTSYNIEHIYTAVYSPQSNASERVNRSVLAAIRAYLKNDHSEWDKNLTKISCALRNSFHQAIQTSPYHALFGFDMITQGSSYSLLKNLKLLDEPAYHLSRDDSLNLLRFDLRKHIREAYETNRERYNLRSKPQSFNIGQEVFRRSFVQSCSGKNFNAKLSPLFIKSRVREKLGSHYYLLEDLQGRTLGTFHAKDIRL